MPEKVKIKPPIFYILKLFNFLVNQKISIVPNFFGFDRGHVFVVKTQPRIFFVSGVQPVGHIMSIVNGAHVILKKN
jgi:hypothetical protein